MKQSSVFLECSVVLVRLLCRRGQKFSFKNRVAGKTQARRSRIIIGLEMSENQTDCWKLEHLCVNLVFNDDGEYVEDPGEIDLASVSTPSQNEEAFDTVVQGCEQVYNVLLEANLNQQDNAQCSYVITNVHYQENLGHGRSENPGDFVFLTMELGIGHLPITPQLSNPVMLGMLRHILESNSGRLNIRPESVDIYELNTGSTEHQLIFTFLNDVVIGVRFAPREDFAN